MGILILDGPSSDEEFLREPFLIASKGFKGADFPIGGLADHVPDRPERLTDVSSYGFHD
jgi:hypothetical protein